MSRPSITPENYVDVYDYYRQHQLRPTTSRILFGAAGQIFRPRITFEDTAQEKIRALLDSGRNVVLAANHVNNIDPAILASLPSRTDTLRPLIGNAFIPAKPSLFKLGGRYLLDDLGAIPVWRKKDLPDDADEDLFSNATRALIHTCIAKMDAGQSMGIFPEGTRNKRNPGQVQEIQGGVGVMVCRVSQVEQPPVIAVGIHYDQGPQHTLTPNVFVSAPSPEPFAKARHAVDWITDQLQASVDQARDL